jgi:hypothetical protein
VGSSLDPEAIADVLEDSQVRKQCPPLKHHRGRAAVGRNAVDTLVPDVNRPFVRSLKAAEDAQESCLAAATWAEQGEELTSTDGEADLANGKDLPESFRYPTDGYLA